MQPERRRTALWIGVCCIVAVTSAQASTVAFDSEKFDFTWPPSLLRESTSSKPHPVRNAWNPTHYRGHDASIKPTTATTCPFATRPAMFDGSSVESQRRVNLALRLEEASRNRKSRPSENATKEIDKVVKVAATKMACVAELCRERKPKRCDAKKPYREADGTCNNLENPEWGAAGACMRRMLPQIYSDGVSSPRVSRRSGEPLPSARLVSYTAHPQGFASDERMSRMMQRFGQFVAHDISSALVIDAEGPEFFQNLGRDTYKCCDPTQSSDPECYRIDIPEQDPFYAQFNNTCMNFRRAAPCLTCKLGPREQVNALTSYIDGSPIYGISEVQTRRLRFLQKGLLREQVVGGSRLLPASRHPDIDQCSKQKEHQLCFESGDRRGNQNFGILSMHITWFREHNRIARNLALINPHWDDERLFQVTRRIVEARLQHIVYNELLEEILGPEVMKREQLRPRRDGYTKYNPSVDATVVNEFTTAAFRLGHALVGRDPDVKLPGDVPLRYQFFHPFAFYNAGFPDAFITKRLNEPVQKFGRYGDPEVTRHLFRFANGPKPFGVDLFAFDVQRGRDHGLRSYADFVEHCVPGVRIESFRDLEQLMPTDAVDVFERLYKDVRDVDLFSAGLAESGSHVVGPTFTCLIAPMFAKLKFGDRFYYEHGGQAGSFTPGQLKTIRDTTLAKVICENGDSVIHQIQPRALRLQMPGNEVTLCSKLPDIDLTEWEEKL